MPDFMQPKHVNFYDTSEWTLDNWNRQLCNSSKCCRIPFRSKNKSGFLRRLWSGATIKIPKQRNFFLQKLFKKNNGISGFLSRSIFFAQNCRKYNTRDIYLKLNPELSLSIGGVYLGAWRNKNRHQKHALNGVLWALDEAYPYFSPAWAILCAARRSCRVVAAADPNRLALEGSEGRESEGSEPPREPRGLKSTPWRAGLLEVLGVAGVGAKGGGREIRVGEM